MAKQNRNFLEKLKLDFKKIILIGIGLNILFLLFGIIVFMNAKEALHVAGVIGGIYYIIFGIFSILEYLNRGYISIFKDKIVLGILEIILGVFAIINPFKTFVILTFALGIYLILVALSKFIQALRLKKLGFDGWIVILLTSILLLIFGVFIAINPMKYMEIAEAMAIFIILGSILEICNLIMIYAKAKEFLKLFKKEK